MSTFRVDWHDGWLCVVESSPAHDTPEMVASWWPCVRCGENDRTAYVGAEVRPTGLAGEWRVWPAERLMLAVTLRAVDGGKTRPVRTDRTPIPQPKVRKGTDVEYRVGRWFKRSPKGTWREA